MGRSGGGDPARHYEFKKSVRTLIKKHHHMTIWNPPHISKIYEAVSAIADDRVLLVSENESHCTSTSRGKYYTTTYDPETNSIMSNDNTAYYTLNMSYPMIALLMLKDVIPYDPSLLEPLKNIPWKDINQQYKDDYDLGLDHYFKQLMPKNVSEAEIKSKIQTIYQYTYSLQLNYLGKKIKPPTAY